MAETQMLKMAPDETHHVRFSQRASRTKDQPISFLMQQAVANPHVISLAAGLVDQESLPVRHALEALQQLLANRRSGLEALQYGTTQGDQRLRELMAEHLRWLEHRAGGQIDVEPDDVVITTGSQQLLQLVSDVLIDPGDVVLVGSPDYFVYMGTLDTLGARVIGVPMDQDGMIPEALDESFQCLDRTGDLPRVKLVYCDSYFQNPTGVTLSEERRPEILDLVRKWSAHGHIYVLEDAAYRELYYSGASPRSVRSFDETGQTVILAQTFSKSLAPGLKTGYAVLPRSLREPVLQQKGNHDFGSANFIQHLLASLMDSGRYREHVGQLRSIYRRKRDVMMDAVRSAFAHSPIPVRWLHPRGGLYVWGVFPESVNTRRDGPLFNACVDKGVLYVPGEFCYPRETLSRVCPALGTPATTVRLTYGCLPDDSLREGVRRLADAVAQVG